MVKMKIWVIGRNYPMPNNKMCGSFEYEQAQILAKNGQEVCYIVCPFHPLYKAKKWGAADWQEDNLHVYAYSQLYFPQRMNVYWDTFKKAIWSKLLNRVKEEQGVPDIIHLHYPTMISVPEPILAFKSMGTKIIATEHWSNVLRKKLTDHANAQLLEYVQKVDHFVCVGRPLKESVQELTGTSREIDVIPNAVPDIFISKGSNRAVGNNTINFISVGRLEKEKQFDKIINAFADVCSKELNITLTIVGSGSQMRKLKRLAANKGVGGHVLFAGSQPRIKVAEMMSNSDALISYSKFETFGVPIIEAWYSGIPAIASTEIGFSEYWKDFLGELVSIENENMLVHAIENVMNNIKGKSYSRQVIQEYARDHFSETAICQRLFEIYKE